MRIAFSTLPSPGHMNPMTTLARKMRERGHEVFFTGIPDCEPFVRGAGFEFRGFGARQFPAGFSEEWLARQSRLHGLEGLRATVEILVQGLEMTVREAPPVLYEARADALVWDEVGRGAFLVAAQLDVPLIQIANALPMHLYDSVPPPFSGWPYRPDAIGKIRNRIGYAAFGYFMRPALAAFSEHARRLGVPLDGKDRNHGLSKLACIAQLPSAFDFPNPELPSWFYHTGPFHDGLGRPHTDFVWDRLSGDPIIYASMGTVQNGFELVFRTIAEACSGLGCQLVMSLGSHVTQESAGPLAGNCVAVRYAPQLELLRRAALCITHAGMNTALESLAAGVPMVAIPITNDQPGVAARVAYTRTGVVVPYRRLNAVRLRRAVREVLNDSRYRENARRIAAAVQAANGLERAADIIEESLRLPRQRPQNG
ncbi:MAG TPA: glycosyltransferase [Candidatus Acidoferrales bacterium]|nr:glycosyltransferase [Candidatus Acidoferrales bacterium]